ncbi:MAG: tetratricopeptide repeat protein [Desulfobacterales bacterium]|nr:tetratricopeptide repeat protein [Desulfobacterales bacterium]
MIKSKLIICIVLMLLILVAYLPLLDNSFITVFDDNLYVTGNNYVRSGISVIGFTWAFTTHHATNWHPITWFSHMLDCELYGMDPRGHHWTSLLIHIVNTLLLFFVLSRMTKALWQSAFVAVLFALHPLHVESVAWISERKDVLCTFFGILAIGSYYHYIKEKKYIYYFFVFLFLCLGLMAKPMLVTLPFVLILLDYWPLGRFSDIYMGKNVSKKQKIKEVLSLFTEKIPLLIPVIISCAVTYIAQHSGGAVKAIDQLPISIRIGNAFISYVSYAVKTVWPHNLAIYYPHPGNDLLSTKVLLSAVFITCSLILAIRLSRQYKYIITGLLWYLGTLVPVIGIVQVGEQGMADRYTYIPLIGLFIIFSWGVADLMKKYRFKRIVLFSSAVLIVSCLTILTFSQVKHWRNGISLFKHAVAVTENNWMARFCLAAAYHEKEMYEKEIYYYKEILKNNPEDYKVLLNMGNLFYCQGNYNKALLYYNKALKSNIENSKPHNNIGNVYMALDKEDKAFSHYKKALKINPQYVAAHENFGRLLLRRNNKQEAMLHFIEVIKNDPYNAPCFNQIGVLFTEKGLYSKAKIFFSRAVEIDSGYIKARNNLTRLNEMKVKH